MRSPSGLGALLLIIGTAIGCGDPPRRVADAADTAPAVPPPPPKPKVWEPKPIVAPPAPAAAVPDTTTADTASSGAPADSAAAPRKPRPRGPRPFVLSPADSAKWPVPSPEPMPGALLPDHRIIAYYGNPRSVRMGIMGQIPPDSMLPRLEEVATRWA